MNRTEDSFHNRLGAHLGVTLRMLKQRLVQNLEEAGCEITAEHLVLLNIIQAREGVGQQTLTDSVPHDKTATTRFINFLEGRRPVRRVSDRVDRLQNLIFFTDRGRQTTSRWAPMMVQAKQEALKSVSSQQVEVLEEVVLLMRRNLGE